MNNSIIITTTNNIEGNEILEYLGLVKAHCTAGIGFFGDIAAGLTDIFGGRSETYEEQMQLIDNTVIEGLIEKAQNLNADAIIGIHIDNDEISGKGTQMLMVTAYGTAVKLKHLITAEKKEGLVQLNDLKKIETRNDIIKRSAKLPFDYANEDWHFIYNEKVIEIAQRVIDNIIYWEQSSFEASKGKLESCLKYFIKLGEQCKEIIYGAIKKHPNSAMIFIDIIKKNNLCDYQQINSLLQESAFTTKKCILDILYADKNQYTPQDIIDIKLLIETIEKEFTNKSKIIEEKSLLSNSIQKKWICECGEKNKIEDEYCKKCNRDQFGFERYELKKEQSIKLLNEKIHILETIFRNY